MKKYILFSFIIIAFHISVAQSQSAFQDGEWFKFRVSYSGWLKAGEATLDLKEKTFQGKKVYHVVGKGWTSGAIKWFFKLKDRYESFIDVKTGLPYKFIRDINEDGHTKDIEIAFNHATKKAEVNDKKHKIVKIIDIETNVQDMVSAFYYLRNNYDTDKIQPGDIVNLNMFFDEENYLFRLKYLGRETIRTNINGSSIEVETLKFRPYVMSGRVFKEEESLTVWISADKNKIPLKIQADLAVGSLRADLEYYKGLKHSFEVKIKD